MRFTGVWRNSYGSVMSLEQRPCGLLAGTYESMTGSSGVYRVAGFADVQAPSAQQGRAASLSIFWRSVLGGAGDPSWHWVSGLGGQLVVADGAPTLTLLHALVVTAAFPSLTSTGTYLDKLVYTRQSDAVSCGCSRDAFTQRVESCADAVDGLWACEQHDSMFLDLKLLNPDSGYISGALLVAGASRSVCGFTDPRAATAHLPLQSVSLAAAFDAAEAQSLSMAGSLHRESDSLSFTVFASRGTAPGATYLQSSTSCLTFRRRRSGM